MPEHPLVAQRGPGTYRATDLVMDRAVLLKTFDSRVAEAPHVRKRFLERLAAVAQMRHPNVATVLDGGIDDSAADEPRPYVVMEPLRAPSLGEVLRRQGALSGPQACGYALQIGAALSYAHRRGLVHGRLGPESVLIDDARHRVTLLGFVDAAAPASGRGRSPDVVGHLSEYLAPEIRRGERAGITADVFSLGVLLREMLTGCPPSAPEPTVRDRLHSDKLDAVIAKAIDDDPGKRWPTIDELMAALRYVRSAEPMAIPVQPTVVRPPIRRRTSGPAGLPSLLALGFTVAAFLATFMYIGKEVADIPIFVNGAAVTVPNLVGKTADESLKLAQDHQMELIVIGTRPSDRIPVGQVMHQSPIGGWRPFSKQPIRVTISSGVEVPDFRDRPLADVAKEAASLGWRIARVEAVKDSGKAASTVLMQFPEPGEVATEAGELAIVIAE